MKNWTTVEQAIQMAKMMKEWEDALMWGTPFPPVIDSRTPIKKIKDFLRNYMKK